MSLKKKRFAPGEPEGLANAQRPPHLTAEQMEAMLRPSAFRNQAGKHLEGCAPCRDEVERLREVLGDFRGASVLYAERVQERRAAGARRPPIAVGPWRWSVAAGALACALAGPALLHLSRHGGGESSAAKRPVVTSGRGAEISDEALLEGVQEDLTMSVPAPLQSLAVTSSSASGSATASRTRLSLHRRTAATAVSE